MGHRAGLKTCVIKATTECLAYLQLEHSFDGNGLIIKGLILINLDRRVMASGLLHGPLAGTHRDQLLFATHASPRHLLRGNWPPFGP
jgi:hypothetical protein